MAHPAHDPAAIDSAADFALPEGYWPVVSRSVAEREATVAAVYHAPDGGWWFLSEADDELVPVCLPCLLTAYPEVRTFSDLPLDWAAVRHEGEWHRTRRPLEWGPWE
jgi:hypothetical protein